MSDGTFGGISYQYYYDEENRLTDVNDLNDDPIVNYEYDYLGRMIYRTTYDSNGVPDVVTEYCYDGMSVIAEYENSVLVRKFIYADRIDEPIVMITVDGANETRYYYHYDGLGSVIGLSDSAGNVVEAYVYSVFGDVRICTGPGVDGVWRTGDDVTGSASAAGNPFMFTGRRYDGDAGLYYYRARFYNADIGRFLQADPLGYVDGMNLYSYCGNNPVNWIDPWGLNIRRVGHGWGNWHQSIQVDNPDGGGYSDYTYHMNDNGRSWWQQTRGQFWWGGKEAGRNGIVAKDGWGDGNTLEEIKTTPEQDRQFIEFLDSQVGQTGPYGPPWGGYNCHDWTDQMFDIAESFYGDEIPSEDDFVGPPAPTKSECE